MAATDTVIVDYIAARGPVTEGEIIRECKVQVSEIVTKQSVKDTLSRLVKTGSIIQDADDLAYELGSGEL